MITATARVVLEDCRGALLELQDGIQGLAWRRHWITVVVLLRTVGHVLDKVDGKRDGKAGQMIDKWWKSINDSRSEHRIFFEFIEQERNNILKEYVINAGQGITIRVGDSTKPFEYHYLINSGPFKGRDQRELVSEAIKWWETQLDKIDSGSG